MRNRDRVGGACHLAALTGLAVAVVACDAGGTADRIAAGAAPATATCSAGRHDTLVLRSLLEATRDRVSAEERKRLIEQAGELPRDAASWPIHVFLQAELHRLTGDGPSAQAAYRDLVEWAAADPCGDGWGGSGLVALALWRWLEGAPDGVDVAEARRILDAAAELRSARLVRGMLDTGLVESLPRLEEEVLRWLARLAWRIGDRHRARQIFLHYLGVAGVSEFDAVDAVIAEDVLAAGLASRDWLTLVRGRRLLALGRYDEASALVGEARRSPDREVRAAAGLELASLERIQDERKLGAQRGDVVRLLDTVVEEAGDPEVAQRALFTRAIVLNREGPGRDAAAFERDLVALVEQFPHGRQADDALYELARYHERNGETDRALELFERLRRFGGQNDWIDSAHVRPAMALYTRDGSGDRERASALLRELLDQYPSSPFRLRALFWLGRIAHEAGDTATAREALGRVVAESPYDWYAIRARMWLRSGEAARRELWPDPATRREIRAAFAASAPPPAISGASAYHVRVDEALESGLYRLAGGAQAVHRQRFPGRRLEELPLDQADRDGLLTHFAVLLALRQDALAAKDTAAAAENRLEVAGGIGQRAGDWTMALLIVLATGEPAHRRAAAQRDAQYLATAYPLLFAEEIRESSARRGLRPELLYSLVRMESLLNPAALSPRGALGLAQFMPDTFHRLDRRWNLLDGSGAKNREAFLTTPALALDLGARWLADELLRRQSGDIVLAVMEHNAGYAAVREWAAASQRSGRSDDVEHVVENIRFAETHLFTRRVLADLVIVDAAGLLRPEKAEQP
jgi:soluble lytic murein transglycosylase-like protein